MIKAALREHHGRVEPAAKSLGISRKGLYLKRQRLGLVTPASSRRRSPRSTPSTRVASRRRPNRPQPALSNPVIDRPPRHAKHLRRILHKDRLRHEPALRIGRSASFLHAKLGDSWRFVSYCCVGKSLPARVVCSRKRQLEPRALRLESGPMHGLMMDYPLTVNAIFRRAEALFGRTRDRHPACRFDPSTVMPTRTLRPHPTPRRGLAAPRIEAGRSGCDARMESLAASRGVFRHPARRRRAAHLEPPFASRRTGLYRVARRGSHRVGR